MNKNTTPKIGISFSPYGKTYGRYGENKFLKTKQHGFDAVDYNISNTESELYSLNDEELKLKITAEKKSADQARITISQLHGPWRYPPQDSTKQEREDWLEKMKRAVVICSYLGCRHLVVHPLMPFGTRDLERGIERETFNINREFFEKLVPFAMRHNVIICLENMPMLQFSLATPSQILNFVQSFNSDFLKICFDTGHAAVFPKISVGNEIRRLNDHIKIFHIHDNLGDKDSHLYPTKGIINWSDFARALTDIGFEGVLSLETAPGTDLNDTDFEQESIFLCRLFKTAIEQSFGNS